MRHYTRSAPKVSVPVRKVARTPTSAASTLLSMLGALGVARASGLQRRPPGRRISPGVPTRAGLGTCATVLRRIPASRQMSHDSKPCSGALILAWGASPRKGVASKETPGPGTGVHRRRPQAPNEDGLGDGYPGLITPGQY